MLATRDYSDTQQRRARLGHAERAIGGQQVFDGDPELQDHGGGRQHQASASRQRGDDAP